MKRITRVISRPTEKSGLTHVEFTDGKTTFTGHLTAEELQKHDLMSQLVAQGANESLLEDLCQLCDGQGYDRGWTDGYDSGFDQG